MAQLHIISNSLSETTILAGCFVSCLRHGMVVGLEGPLGVGKSAFARCVIQAACGADTDVPSPTFTLVQNYQTQAGLMLVHMDLYRLDAPEDAFALGIEDSFYEAANLVEWPSKMAGYWPEHALMIKMAFGEEATRHITLSAPQDVAEPLYRAVAERGLEVQLSAG